MAASSTPTKSPRKVSGISASSSKFSLLPTPTKQSLPRDLRDALSWLHLSGLSGLERGVLSQEAFLKPWAHYRDAYLLLQPQSMPRNSPPGHIKPVDILHYYTWYDEGALRYDATADENSFEYEPDPSRRATLDKSEWTVQEHEKFLYVWLLQTFKVGKFHNAFGFKYFECKNIAAAWQEVFLPIVHAVVADYDIRGRRYYGRLAKFIENVSPSRLAFPEANVGASVKALEVPRAAERESVRQVSGETDPFTNIWVSKKGKSSRQNEEEEIDRELRVAFPGFGHLVERPKVDVRAWVRKQSEAVSHKRALQGLGANKESENRFGDRMRRVFSPSRKSGEESPRKQFGFSRKRGDTTSSYPSPASTNRNPGSSKAEQSPSVLDTASPCVKPEKHCVKTEIRAQSDNTQKAVKRDTLGSVGDHSDARNSSRDSGHGASHTRESDKYSEAYTEPGFGPETYDPFFQPHHAPQASFASSGDNHNVYHNFQRELAKEKMSPSRESILRSSLPKLKGARSIEQAGAESTTRGFDRGPAPSNQSSQQDENELTSFHSFPSYVSTDASSSHITSQASVAIPLSYSRPERTVSDKPLGSNKPSRIPSPVYAQKNIYSYAPRASVYKPTGMPRGPTSPIDKNKALPPAPSPIPAVPLKNPRRYNSIQSTTSSLAASSIATSLPKSRSNRLIAEASSSSLLGPRIVSKENIRAALGNISASSRESLAEQDDDLNDPIISPATTHAFAGMGGRGLNTGELAPGRTATPVLRTYNSHMFPRKKESMNSMGGAGAHRMKNENEGSREYEMDEVKKGDV
ncbi:hypothetical protein BDV96DRAFT_594775 [Lophiotrema nucula]|uniref:Uncharacterized protein n=1 Tax=Lophiotrema nucula TaxID=690887 RepID=A0A6A5ZR23_9PLEO|nr:hypothetical protein BDV96DRAFT_594775 [Lophiotrema nucula]